VVVLVVVEVALAVVVLVVVVEVVCETWLAFANPTLLFDLSKIVYQYLINISPKIFGIMPSPSSPAPWVIPDAQVPSLLLKIIAETGRLKVPPPNLKTTSGPVAVQEIGYNPLLSL